eukprot:TRINITY_DN70687_c0_g1_i1.p1 TRINITY_DN70687_c0_g1~~TRINITY_DN70687_c0_g1_i1.p1  ORF type:complete len:599 (+),score=132.19 TRINITY_DN70687_c0_g1_i1:89-1798(+)
MTPADGPWRMAYDSEVSFGDGGECTLLYPVVFRHSLLPPDTRAALLEAMRGLAEPRKDVQQNGIVEDIVDPDLAARQLGSTEAGAVLQRVEEACRDSDYEDDDEDDDRKGQPSEYLMQRTAYQWIPTIFDCNPCFATARALTDIHGMPPRSAAEGLYAHIEQLLGRMLPLFAGVMPETELNGRLQVVVKVQRYNLPPRVKYGGRWHTEGFTEKVKAAGVYYIEHPVSLSGGQLKFRPRKFPDEGYQEYAHYRPHCALPVGTEVETTASGQGYEAGQKGTIQAGGNRYRGEMVSIHGGRVVQINRAHLRRPRLRPPELWFAGKALDNSLTLADAGVSAEAAVELHPGEGRIDPAPGGEEGEEKDGLPVYVQCGGERRQVDVPGGATVLLLLQRAVAEFGGMSFKPLAAPRDYPVYRKPGDDDEMDDDEDQENCVTHPAQFVEVKEGTAVAFSNDIPHRFTNIENATEQQVQRTFINFFVIDPAHPLPAPKPVVGAAYEAAVADPKKRQVRDRARAGMQASPSGWGWINYGNCGQIEFMDDWKLQQGKYDAHANRTRDSSGEPSKVGHLGV